MRSPLPQPIFSLADPSPLNPLRAQGLLTARDVMGHLDLTERELRHWIRKRGLPHIEIDGYLFFVEVSVMEWLARQQTTRDPSGTAHTA